MEKKMKKIISFLVMVYILTFGSINLNAQECPSDIKGDPSCPDPQLYEDQAVIRINKFKERIKALEAELQTLVTNYDNLVKKLEETKANLTDCNDELYKMLGASLADINAFREKLGRIEGKIREMQRLSDDVLADRQDDVYALEDELNELRLDKIALLPEFFNKIQRLAKEINPGLIREKKIRQYTVKSWFENKDCLWNISGNMDIYGDPLQWPKIWQANTDIIRNPDIIHPGQVLTIPEKGPKTSDEIKAERRYWREKREKAMEEEQMGNETQGQ